MIANRHRIDAFNLQEMLTVLAIIGILLLIAMPKLMPLITKTKTIEAQTQLKAIYNFQQQHRALYSKYSPDFSELDYELPKTVKENGTANYRYEILESSEYGFKARAEAVVDFDGDGVFNVWEIDQDGKPQQIVKD